MKLNRVLPVLLACAAMVAAQEAAPAAAAPAAAPAPAPVKKAAAKTQVVKGTLVAVDAAANVLIVKTAKAEDTLAVDSLTKVVVAGKKAALADLKPEAQVTVKVKTKDGKKVATEVTEKKVAAKKAAAAPAPAPAPASSTAAPAAPAPAPAPAPAK